jgi:predicted nuclease with TOPRIM domain
MENSEDLGRLEQFVERLLASHNQLKNENQEIKALLQQKEQEISELKETNKGLQENKSVMHDRVTGLLDKIDEWEKVFESAGAGQSNNSSSDQAQNVTQESSPLFNVGAEQSPDTAN